MKLSNGLGTYVSVWREGSHIRIDARVGIVPMLIQYLVLTLLIVWRISRRKRNA